MSATLLVVEDEAPVRELLGFHLEQAGFRVRLAPDAEVAWPLLAGSDLVVLDRMLPGASGLELLRRLRASDFDRLPVLLLTARGSELDRVEGLESGADDYVVKPFSSAELVARVRALLRRASPRGELHAGEAVIDEEGGRVLVGAQEVPLTRREFELLAFLARHPGRIFARGELLDRVWGHAFVGTERTVDQHVAQLRSRLGGEVIETVRGRGYRVPADDD